MNNPTEYLGGGNKATMNKNGAIEIVHTDGDYIILTEKVFQSLVKFRAAAQCEIALRQSLQPAYEAIEQSMKETKI